MSGFQNHVALVRYGSPGPVTVNATPISVQVNNVAPTVAVAVGSETSGVRGQTRDLNLAASDPSSVDQASTFTYKINWGDGSGLQTVTGTSAKTVSHAYAFDGTYSVTITAT